MSKASPRSRTALARALLLLVSLLVVLGLAEGAARLSWNEKERRPAPAEYDASLPRIKGLRALAAPHVRGVHKGVLYRTNSRAIRGPEYAERPPAGVFRVAITGDSVTMGWGVEEAEAYPALLEQGLSAHPVAPDARRSYQVLNFGLAGLNADGAVSRLIKKSAYYRPSLVVYGFTVNDIEGPHFRRSDPQTDESPGNQSLANRYRAQRFSPSYLLRILWPNWVALQEMWSPTPGTHQAALLENYFENPAAFAALDAALGRLAAHAEEQGICAHVLVHTQLSQLGPFHPYSSVYDVVAQAADRHGLGVTTTESRFDRANAAGYWVSYWDAHPNAAAHRVLAEALEEGLRGLPAACWQASAGPPADPGQR
jgi:lysophospholipase L1-like esterase